MIQLIFEQQYIAFVLLLGALLISLSLHEFGHAAAALWFGDDTAKRAGRFTVNPIAHIDPMGLLMVVLIGFGYAKPVPTNPAKFNSRWGTLWVAAAGPAMNLIVAIIAINIYILGLKSGIGIFQSPVSEFLFTFLALINLLLMLFNLLPIGPLDGHYILPYFLSRNLAYKYLQYNYRYGTWILLSLIGLNLIGFPIFEKIWNFGQTILGYIIFV